MFQAFRIALVALLLSNVTGIAEAQDSKPKVHWTSDIVKGFQQSRASGKCLIVYFCREPQEEELPFELAIEVVTSRFYEQEIFPSRGFQAYAEKAIFVRQSVSKLDPAGLSSKILKEMKIDRFPAIVVFDTAEDELITRGTIKGMFKCEEFLKNFRTVFQNRSSKLKTAEAPAEPQNSGLFEPALVPIFDPDDSHLK